MRSSPWHLLFLFVFLLIGNGLNAQNKPENKAPFLRIYNLNGKKVLKGRINKVTDESISLIKGDKVREIDISEIGYIRTKHSVGNNVLMGAIAGSVFFGTVTAADADPDAWIFSYTPAEGAVIGVVAGAPIGGTLGLITAIFKKKTEFEINGQPEKWREIMPYFQ